MKLVLAPIGEGAEGLEAEGEDSKKGEVEAGNYLPDKDRTRDAGSECKELDPARNIQHDAGNIFRVIRSQENNGMGHVFRLSWFLERRPLD